MNDSTRKQLKEYGLTIIIATMVALMIRFYVIEAYRIPNSSMRPTLDAGDTIFVSKWGYGGRTPKTPRRGDVIIFSPQADKKHDYIKRVVGLPGDRISIQKGQILLNGSSLTRTRENRSTCGSEKLPEGRIYSICWEPPILEDMTVIQVPENQVFAVSDLRTKPNADSHKSVAWDMVPITLIKGKALWIWLSIQPATGGATGWFPQIRFDRMFRRIT